MNKRIYVTITDSLIKKARRLCKKKDTELGNSCMVALALKKQFPNKEVNVGENFVSLGGEAYQASGNLLKQISRFDHKGEPKAGVYCIYSVVTKNYLIKYAN